MTTQWSSQLPNRDAPAVREGGLLSEAWFNFMAFMASLTARDVQQVTVGASPYSYEASTIGHLHVAAGTVSSVVLQRGGVTLACPTSGFVPMVAGDIAVIEYVVVPTVYFVPGART